MEKKVKALKYNWRQAGSALNRDGVGEDYDVCKVGEKGVVSIEENEPHNGMQLWNYVVYLEDGGSFRIFNPNFVVYSPPA